MDFDGQGRVVRIGRHTTPREESNPEGPSENAIEMHDGEGSELWMFCEERGWGSG